MEEISKVVSRQDILEGPYRNNPNVHAAISLWMRGGCTWEQAMMYCVTMLTGQVELLEDHLSNKISKEPPSNWNGIQRFLVGR